MSNRPTKREDIIAFQQASGLQADGIWGRETEAAWNKSNPSGVYNGGFTSPEPAVAYPNDAKTNPYASGMANADSAFGDLLRQSVGQQSTAQTAPASARPVWDADGSYTAAMDAAAQAVRDWGPYVDPYADDISTQKDKIMNRDPFSYDYTTDPAWQAYKKQYTREGQRATEDVLGQYAAMTGGMPSTAAVTAASQAGDYYNAQMTDKIPELYRLAYQMYLDDAGLDYQTMSMLRGLSGDAYGRWSDDFNRAVTKWDLERTRGNDAYGRYRDTVGDWERDRAYTDSRNDLAYDRAWNEDERGYTRRWKEAEKKAAMGDYSGYEALGIDTGGTKIFAYGADGSTYDIGSPKGLYFVQYAPAGAKMTGGDGSTWEKDELGNITITRGDQTWRITVAEPMATGGAYVSPYDTHGMSAREIEAWQSEHGLNPDGAWGPQTEAAWNASHGYNGSNPYWGVEYQPVSGPGTRDRMTSLDYSQDEGVFTWNGKSYSDPGALASDIDNSYLTDEEKERLARTLGVYGFDISFV